MKTVHLVIEYWDPKKHKVFVGPYLRKYWYLGSKRIKHSDPIIVEKKSL